jgi:hypothetical protein
MLRGAPVEVDVQRVTQIVSVLIIATLTVLTVAFFLSGLHRNSDVSNLQRHGVVVAVTTTTCTGELGGSGSTLADYRCEGTFTLNGHRVHDTIPGHAFRATGSKADFVTSTEDPSLLATSRQVKIEHTTWSVYIVPFVLLVVLLACVGIVARRRWLRSTIVKVDEIGHSIH